MNLKRAGREAGKIYKGRLHKKEGASPPFPPLVKTLVYEESAGQFLCTSCTGMVVGECVGN